MITGSEPGRNGVDPGQGWNRVLRIIGHNMIYTSPIPDDLIAGRLYWDTVSTRWWRLITRPSQDVIGYYREDFITARFIAVRHYPDYHQTRHCEQRIFDTTDCARQWIEQFAKEIWYDNGYENKH